MRTIKYFENIHITFITVYHNTYSIIVVNILLCPVYKLNFIIGMYT